MELHKKQKATEFVSLRLSESTATGLRKKCGETGISLSEGIRQLIEQYLDSSIVEQLPGKKNNQ